MRRSLWLSKRGIECTRFGSTGNSYCAALHCVHHHQPLRERRVRVKPCCVAQHAPLLSMQNEEGHIQQRVAKQNTPPNPCSNSAVRVNWQKRTAIRAIAPADAATRLAAATARRPEQIKYRCNDKSQHISRQGTLK